MLAADNLDPAAKVMTWCDTACNPQRWCLRFLRTNVAALAIAGMAFQDTALGQSVEEFYKNATVNLYVGSGVGGGYDAVARTFAQFYGRHIPGKPNVIVRNMPGAGGLANANFMFNSAPRDGSAIAAPFNTVMMLPRLRRSWGVIRSQEVQLDRQYGQAAGHMFDLA